MPNDFSFKGPGEPAFPAQSRNGHETFNTPLWGLTKREYFAARALQGMLSGGAWQNDHALLVKSAVFWADQLILELANNK